MFFFNKVVNNHVRLTLDSRVRFSRDVDRGYALRSMDVAAESCVTFLFCVTFYCIAVVWT